MNIIRSLWDMDIYKSSCNGNVWIIVVQSVCVFGVEDRKVKVDMSKEQKEVSIGCGAKLTLTCCSEYLMNTPRIANHGIFTTLLCAVLRQLSTIIIQLFTHALFEGYLHWFYRYRLHKHCLNILLSNPRGSVKSLCQNMWADIKVLWNLLICFQRKKTFFLYCYQTCLYFLFLIY